MTDEAATPAAAVVATTAPPSRGRRVPVLAILLAALVVGGNLLFRPYFACRADDPATLHVALGTHPAWSPPTARDAFGALQRRFPERVGGDPGALPEAELARLYLVRPNAVRAVLHWAAGATLVLAAAVAERRRSRRRTSPVPRS